MADDVRVRVIVSGRVQGVFFRAEARDMASRLGLAGWIRNRPDGAVEALFQGRGAAVAEAVAWCRTGPSMAAVDSVDVVSEQAAPIEGFRIAG